MSTKTEDAFDVPHGGLRSVGRVVRDHNSVAVAIAEVRFAREDAAISETEAGKILDLLDRQMFPIIEPTSLNIMNLTVTPDRTDQTTQVQKGWILATADRTLSIILMPSSVVVQTVKYERFSTSMEPQLIRAISAYASITGARLVQRIGLRYVNRLIDSGATHPRFWVTKVKAPFAGALESDLCELVESLHQQVNLRLEPNVGSIIHSGAFLDQASGGTFGFLVDIDVFREQAIDFNLEHIGNLVRQLNRTAHSLFATVLADEALDDMSRVEMKSGQ